MEQRFTARVARAGIWSTVRTATKEVVGFVVFLVLARFFLDDEQFGVVALANTMMVLCQTISRLGISTALIQRAEISDDHRNAAFWSSTGLSVVLAVLFFLFAPRVAEWVNEPELAPVLRALVVGLVFAMLSATHDALLVKDLSFKILAVRTLLASLGAGILAITTAALGWGVWSLVVLHLSMGLIDMVCVWYSHPWRPRLSFDIGSFKDLMVTGLNVSGIGLISYVSNYADKLLLGSLVNVAQLGQYFLAQRILMAVMTLFGRSVTSVALPSFSQLADDLSRVCRGLILSGGIVAATSFPVLLGAAALGEEAIPFLVGEKWATAGKIVRWHCLGGIPQVLLAVAVPVLVAVGHPKKAFQANLVSAVVLLACSALGTRFDAIGVAIAVALGKFVVFFYFGTVIVRVTGLSVRQYVAAIVPPLISATIMAVTVIATGQAGRECGVPPGFVLGGQITVGIVVYIGVLWCIDRSMLQFILQHVKRR